MKRSIWLMLAAFVVVALASFSAMAGTHLTTQDECAAGAIGVVADDQTNGRGSVCVGAAGHNVVYVAGNGNTPCGVVIVADNELENNAPEGDANNCA